MNLESRIKKIEEEIRTIKKRNAKVEVDKAWEISIFRIVMICIGIYLTTITLFYFMKIKDFFLSGLIPTIGFFLSMQSLPTIKKWWIEKYFRRGD